MYPKTADLSASVETFPTRENLDIDPTRITEEEHESHNEEKIAPPTFFEDGHLDRHERHEILGIEFVRSVRPLFSQGTPVCD